MSQNVRLRFAPSPTGPLHIGGVRTALFNYLFTRQRDGVFILRIEDTDRTRYVPGAEEYIVDALAWCGIEFDEGPNLGGDYGPYRQSERQDIYGGYVQKLLESGHAYYAFDTPEELDDMRAREKAAGNHVPKYDGKTRSSMKNSLTMSEDEVNAWLDAGKPYTVRLHIPVDETISFDDVIRGKVSFSTNEMDDKIILKGDGWPTYHVANVIDDYSMKISHVIRGEEWLSSTPHHIFLYQAFGWEESIPEFGHLPLILKPTGKGKLSKRDGQKFGFPVFPQAWKDREVAEENFEGFDSFGFLPEAVVNFLAFLGWNPGDEREVFAMDELISTFDLAQVSKAGARFDFDKARWFNQQHIQGLSDADFLAASLVVMQEAGLPPLTQAMVPLVKTRLHTWTDLPSTTKFFFTKPDSFDEKMIRKKWKEDIHIHYEELVAQLGAVNPFSAANLKAHLEGYLAAHNLGFGQMLPLLRIALSGVSRGPDLFTIMEILGPDEVRERLAQGPRIFAKVGTGEQP